MLAFLNLTQNPQVQIQTLQNQRSPTFFGTRTSFMEDIVSTDGWWGLGGCSLRDNTSYGEQQMKLCLPAPHRLLCDQVSTRLWPWPGSWGPLYRIAPFNWDGSWSPVMHEWLLGTFNIQVGPWGSLYMKHEYLWTLFLSFPILWLFYSSLIKKKTVKLKHIPK